MGLRLQKICVAISTNIWRWSQIILALSLLYYALLMTSLIIRFHNFPNYINFYNWPGNVHLILQSTPSMRDALMIIRDEWLLEIGYMNYDFGHGISEWSMVLAPNKILSIFLLSMLVATQFILLQSRRMRCSRSTKTSSSTCTGLGATFVAISSVSMSWVVCCSTPSWVVGLSMMGLSVSTAFLLEPLGIWLQLFGFVALMFGCFIAASEPEPRTISTRLELIAERI